MRQKLYRLGRVTAGLCFAIGIFVTAVPPPTAFAQDEVAGDQNAQDMEALRNNWPQWDTYNPYGLACDPESATDATLIGSDNGSRSLARVISTSPSSSRPWSARKCA